MDHLRTNFPDSKQITSKGKQRNINENHLTRCVLVVSTAEPIPDGLRSPTEPNFPYHPFGPIPLRSATSEPHKEQGEVVNNIIEYECGDPYDDSQTSTALGPPSHGSSELEVPADLSSKVYSTAFSDESTTWPSSNPHADSSSAPEDITSNKSYRESDQDTSGSKSPCALPHLSAQQESQKYSHLSWSHAPRCFPNWTWVRLNRHKRYIQGSSCQTMSGHWSISRRTSFAETRQQPRRLQELSSTEIGDERYSNNTEASTPEFDAQNTAVTGPGTPSGPVSARQTLNLDHTNNRNDIVFPGERGISHDETQDPDDSVPSSQSYLDGICSALDAISLLTIKISMHRMTNGHEVRNAYAWHHQAQMISRRVVSDLSRLSSHPELFYSENRRIRFLYRVAMKMKWTTEFTEAVNQYLDLSQRKSRVHDNPIAPWAAWCKNSGCTMDSEPVKQLLNEGLGPVRGQFIPTQGLVILEYWRRKQNATVDRLLGESQEDDDEDDDEEEVQIFDDEDNDETEIEGEVVDESKARDQIESHRLEFDRMTSGRSQGGNKPVIMRALYGMPPETDTRFPPVDLENRGVVPEMARLFASYRHGSVTRASTTGLFRGVFVKRRIGNASRR